MLTIIKPTIEDAEGIRHVFICTWLSTYPNVSAGITTADIELLLKEWFEGQEATERLLKQIHDDNPDRLFLVAKEQSRVVGVCIAQKMSECNKLNALYVLPDFQGKGVGKELWRVCSEWFDKNKEVVLYVAEYNTQAMAFYTKLGFHDTGKRVKEERFHLKDSGNYIVESEMRLAKD